MNTISSFVNRHPLSTFFVLAYAFTWLGWTVPDRLYTGTPLTTVLTLPFLLMVPGPLLAALIVTALTSGKAGLMTLLRKFTIWRVGWGWYMVALLLGPVVGLSATYLNVWFGAPDPTALLLAAVPSTLVLFAIRLVNPVDGPMQEELGWRGYALPAFQTRYAPLVANLILGVIVAGWHLPWVWMGQLPFFALLGTVAYTIVAGWIYTNTKGSVLLVLIAHAADGLIRAGFTGVDLTRFFVFYVAAWWVVVLVVLILYGPSLVRKPATQAGVTPVGQPLAPNKIGELV
jgi:membrane protease YdiL (CAAX protease family)